jgi:porphobilinogen synthase
MNYPYTRNRRLRQNAAIRSMVAETKLSVSDLIAPIFIIEGKNKSEELPSMPNYFRQTLDRSIEEVKILAGMGIKAVLLFVKVPDHLKDNAGTEALNANGLMPRAIQAIKQAVPEVVVMSDVALDPYSSYGHDGIVENGNVVNDQTNELLSEMALSHATAGADFVAPSDMMDGRVLRIREMLEINNFHNTGIMAYSTKYASCFYGPFRDALDSAPGFGDKKTYQMDPRNQAEGVREALMDELEGADILMIKPALSYLDVIAELKVHTQLPLAAYQVSGEYAMIKAAAEKGWINEQDAALETLTSIKRAGADLIATYFAKQIAPLLK